MQKKALTTITMLLAMNALGCGSSATDETSETAAAETTGAEATATETAATDTTAADASPAKTETAPATAAEPPAPPKYGAVIMFTVADPDAWKTAFDADVQARKDAGILGHGLEQVAGQPKKLAVFLMTNDIEKTKTYLDDAATKAKLKEEGVKGKVDVMTMENVEFRLAPKSDKTFFAAVVTQEVKDFDAWKTSFDTWTEARTTAGIAGYCIHRDTTNPNKIYTYYQAETLDALKKFVGAKESKDAWKTAGAKGAPKVIYLEEKGGEQYAG